MQNRSFKVLGEGRKKYSLPFLRQTSHIWRTDRSVRGQFPGQGQKCLSPFVAHWYSWYSILLLPGKRQETSSRHSMAVCPFTEGVGMLRMPHSGSQGLPRPEAGSGEPRTSLIPTNVLALVKSNSIPLLGAGQHQGALLWGRGWGLAEPWGWNRSSRRYSAPCVTAEECSICDALEMTNTLNPVQLMATLTWPPTRTVWWHCRFTLKIEIILLSINALNFYYQKLAT